MSWDPLYVYGLRTPRNDSFLAKLPQIPVWLVNPSRWLVPPVLDSEAFEKRLIVDGNRDGSRSVRSDDGGGKLHARGLIGGRAHGLLSLRLVVYPFRELLLDVVQRICGRVSVDVDDANPSVGDPRYPRQKD